MAPRQHQAPEVIYGIHPVLEVLRAAPQRIQKLLLAPHGGGRAIAELRRLARGAAVPVVAVPHQELDRLAGGGRHQGLVAVVSAGGYVELEELLQRCGSQALLLILAGVEDPHNLGAILRSAECAGVDGVILPLHRAAGLGPTVAKVSAGASSVVPVARCASPGGLGRELKERGFRLFGADPNGSQTLWEVDWRGQIALALGAEGKGLGGSLRAECDALLRLPVRGQIGSLNVSVAAGILLYEAVRQRTQF
ncbi:MAG TPA: 23S rRNA (guanosine(2251)-2'-O)-methyltransferase RlmB [Acidobacteriota bacterium]